LWKLNPVNQPHRHESKEDEMSTTGLEVFDKTVQTTNIWLDEIMDQMGPDRHLAWHILGAVLHALRDRLPTDEAAHLAAQLPLLVRGLFYEQWHPAGIRKDRTQQEFLKHVGEGLKGGRPVSRADATRAVFSVLERHITGGEIQKVASSLPRDVRALWPSTTGVAG
jgi:uncharacterized protein (DUF2267 family)